MTGYLHPGYAASLAGLGKPRLLPASGGWILEREIPGSSGRDAMGCYPLFACQCWDRLEEDLRDLEGLVSLALVADPFGDYDEPLLRRCFDRVVPFKRHFVVDLGRPLAEIGSKHHRYYQRRASAGVEVEECPCPAEHLDEWTGLYGHLVRRHGLTGIQAFSRAAFAAQLSTPGLVMLRAVHLGETVGIHLWYLQGEVAYSHLQASSDLGYRLMASYALYGAALRLLAPWVRWLDLGAGAGIAEPSRGLEQFKAGWATGTRTAWFCGRVLDPERYATLSAGAGREPADYFPAYRAGEMEARSPAA
ncbi:MAG TPA: hypothetical protein VHC97_04630 [Thermoanaerobaculia bacterium]|nr:hypothetical protein [Thermoanaerobaculia bacterium]